MAVECIISMHHPETSSEGGQKFNWKIENILYIRNPYFIRNTESVKYLIDFKYNYIFIIYVILIYVMSDLDSILCASETYKLVWK